MANQPNLDDVDLYSPIKGDDDAETWRKLDPLGSSIFGWGNGAWNDAINQRTGQIGATRNDIAKSRLGAIEEATGANQSDWDALRKQIFGDNGQKLSDFYGGLEEGDQSNAADLIKALGGYENAADFFNNPNFMGDVGDVTNSAHPSNQTVADQRDAIAQLRGLTNTQETAAEKLIRLTAEREMEQKMRGDREALNQSLKSRGVYGSGAELVGNLMSQQGLSANREMSNAQANAQAQQRAMQALGTYGQMSSAMRGQEANEGSLANQVAEFNNATNQNLANQRAAAQVGATQRGQQDIANRATAGYAANSDVNKNARADTQSQIDTGLKTTAGATGTRTADTNLLSSGYDSADKTLADAQARLASQKRSSLLGVF